MAMTLIVDASIAVKWLLDEEGSEQARKTVQGHDLAAPAFLRLEVFHVLWRRSRRNEATQAQLHETLPALNRIIGTFERDEPLISKAADIAAAHVLAIYDCLYLALALKNEVALITADQKQLAAARRLKIKVQTI
ncbi:MAG: type II toxin-antitoxin system VapC family toxin [Methylobacteriaceae bacterium]|nr:type II toxin-antitoxin system VapC family toxin [Methylobacteriaceae bacterium]